MNKNTYKGISFVSRFILYYMYQDKLPNKRPNVKTLLSQLVSELELCFLYCVYFDWIRL